MIIRCLIVAVLAGCVGPDEVRVGVGHRDETFSGQQSPTDYDGQQAWLEVAWSLKPTRMVIDYSPAARLFLTEMDLHSGLNRKDPTTVTVNTPKTEAPKGAIGEAFDGAGDLLDRAKDSDDNYTLPGVLALLVVALLITVLMMLRKKATP